MLSGLDKEKFAYLLKSQGIMSMLTKNLQDLTDSEIASLLKIANINDLASQIAIKYISNLQIFNNQVAHDFLVQLSGQQYDKDIVADIFNQTIIKCTKLAITELGKALGEENGVLLNGFLASNAAKILGSILEFEKK